MAQRHRQQSPRLIEDELENTFGLTFIQVLDYTPAPVLLSLYRSAGGRAGEVSLKAVTPRQRAYWSSYVSDQWTRRKTIRPVLARRLIEAEGRINRILALREG